jgi:polar amino acid transport system substrate-binding protein
VASGLPLRDGRAQDPLRLVTGQDYAPFADSRLPGGGLSVMLVRRIWEEAGRTVEIETLPWNRAYEAVVTGRRLGTFPFVETPQRKREMLFSTPLHVVPARLFARSDYRPGQETLEGLKRSRVCQPRGFALHPMIEDAVEAGTFARVAETTLVDCFRGLAAGAVDLVQANELLGNWMIRIAYLDPLRITPRDIGLPDSALHFLIARDTPKGEALMQAFNAALARLRQNGTLAEMVPAYLESF